MIFLNLITHCVLCIECESGKWGKNCRQECGKCDKYTCDLINGICPKGCSAGFKCFEGTTINLNNSLNSPI